MHRETEQDDEVFGEGLRVIDHCTVLIQEHKES